jgi:hypothetical protein
MNTRSCLVLLSISLIVLFLLSVLFVVFLIFVPFVYNSKKGEKFSQNYPNPVATKADRAGYLGPIFVNECQQTFATLDSQIGKGLYSPCAFANGTFSYQNLIDKNGQNDTKCDNSTYVMYKSDDCSNPWKKDDGYFCYGGNVLIPEIGIDSHNPCPQSGKIFSVAPVDSENRPLNPWGCTKICKR